ncbi:MAG: hypothetical protein EP332_14235 [Bacteroidetes bacterium]|nr:MAG: hypothetical protein EP332_14235 [Bacteroidota bacterium]
MNKEYFISEYKSLREKLGRPPKSSEFYQLNTIVKNQFVRAFGSNAYTKLQEASDDTPNKLDLQLTTGDEILNQYGQLIRNLQKLPTHADWDYYGCKPVRIERSPLGWTWKELPQLFLKEFHEHKDWKDVVHLIEAEGYKTPIEKPRKNIDFEKTIEGVKSWNPQRKRFTEETYKVELRGFLQSSRFNVGEEKGDSNIDLLVNNSVAIELKKDPSTSEYDRLAGQMIRHLMIYKYLIVVICDISSEDRFREFMKSIDFIFVPLKLNVEIIVK